MTSPDRQDRRRWTPPTPVADPAIPTSHLPLLGYIRVRPGTAEVRIEALRRTMAAHASLDGFVITRFLVDRSFEHTTAFAELLSALDDGEAFHVLVPALHHFGHFQGVQLAMKDLIESRNDARVRVLVLFPEPSGEVT